MPRSHFLLPGFILLILAAALPARAGDDSQLSADTGGWQRVDERNGVTVYSRTRPGTPVKEFRGTGLIAAPPAAVQHVLNDVPSYPQFMPYVVEARVLSTDGPALVCYERLSLPLIASRDYTVRVERTTSRASSGGTVYRDSWSTDNDAGPQPRAGVVRVKVNEGSWLLESAGAGTQATYQLFTDSGGALPAFVTNRASQTAIPKLFDAIRKQVTK